MDIIEIRKSLEGLPDEIFDVEKEFLLQKAQLEYMENLKKPLLSKLMKEFMGSNAHKEQMAFATEGYSTHIEGIRAQQCKVAEVSARFHRLERLFEAMRSLNKNV